MIEMFLCVFKVEVISTLNNESLRKIDVLSPYVCETVQEISMQVAMLLFLECNKICT